MEIEALLKEYGEKIDETLERFLASTHPSSTIPMYSSEFPSFHSYESDLFYNKASRFTKGPGKRIRPILSIFGYYTFDYEFPVDLTAFASLELFHAYLLIHDDIMDEDDVRRGEPSMHRRFEAEAKGFRAPKHFGESMAMIAGNILAHLGYKALLEADDFPLERRIKAAKFVTDVLLTTGYGQVIDVHTAHMNLEKRPYRSLYMLVKDVHLSKTAVYTFSGPLVFGSILADAPEIYYSQLYYAGLHAGIAFQIKDDIMGLESPEKLLKKKNDIEEGKLTYPILLAAQKDRSVLKHLREGDVDKVLMIVDKTEAIKRSKSDMNERIRRAKFILSTLDNPHVNYVNRYFLDRISDVFDFAIKRER